MKNSFVKTFLLNNSHKECEKILNSHPDLYEVRNVLIPKIIHDIYLKNLTKIGCLQKRSFLVWLVMHSLFSIHSLIHYTIPIYSLKFI